MLESDMDAEHHLTLVKVKFAHQVNSFEVLESVVKNPQIDVIEADIIFSQDKNIPVMGHPPATDSDFTFNAWLEEAIKSDKGLKLDFKDPQVMEYCLEKLKIQNIDNTVFLNADILAGPGATETKFKNPIGFVRICKDTYPRGILSVGWTTQCVEGEGYSQKNVDEMLNVLGGVEGQVTFPVRACYVQKSWGNLQRLIENPNYTLTVWNNEPVEKELVLWIRNTVDPKKVYIDLVNPADMSPIPVF